MLQSKDLSHSEARIHGHEFLGKGLPDSWIEEHAPWTELLTIDNLLPQLEDSEEGGGSLFEAEDDVEQQNDASEPHHDGAEARQSVPVQTGADPREMEEGDKTYTCLIFEGLKLALTEEEWQEVEYGTGMIRDMIVPLLIEAEAKGTWFVDEFHAQVALIPCPELPEGFTCPNHGDLSWIDYIPSSEEALNAKGEALIEAEQEVWEAVASLPEVERIICKTHGVNTGAYAFFSLEEHLLTRLFNKRISPIIWHCVGRNG